MDHFGKGNQQLQTLLENNRVICHPFIIAELVCGQLKNREEILKLLYNLDCAEIIENDELLDFIDYHQLPGQGMGLIDIHLLASALLNEASFWTLDQRIADVASRLDLNWRDCEK